MTSPWGEVTTRSILQREQSDSSAWLKALCFPQEYLESNQQAQRLFVGFGDTKNVCQLEALLCWIGMAPDTPSLADCLPRPGKEAGAGQKKQGINAKSSTVNVKT